MENNTNTNNQVVPIPEKVTKKGNLPPKLQETYDKFKSKYNSLPKTTQKMVIAVGILFAVIFILLLLVILFAPSKKPTIQATPVPTPVSVTPAQNIFVGSKYATDEGVLKIESDLNQIQKDLNTSDVRQTDLNQPSLDFNINFGN